ncbi:hypothetical protein EJ05DRAFT_473913 [Pseudovirgaria hyperparasitica]|uniref:Inositol hexakisphosphate and diphosphoinositol-pentakisphosphate kinase n=1 Tax=Pseudovirgaria hyperparasitica TaxID=470096 RepID=A0A6A6WJC3_9PEZI|nr:uncharacterized protein EJ05DRAFT_473913 [Pseudovirgaria hyperparasitica]KAF2761411.1 hypothetical protein EJ05DRAFT_473913 [Pseudovirgaria hyperparasitica]
MPPPASKSVPRQYAERRASKASDTAAATVSLQDNAGTGQLALPDAMIPPSRSDPELESNRMSFSSLYSVGSAIYNAARGTSGTSSITGSEPEARVEPQVSVHNTVNGPGTSVSSSQLLSTADPVISGTPIAASVPSLRGNERRNTRGRTINQRRISGSTGAASSTSPGSRDFRDGELRRSPIGIIGVCALDAKARSKPSRNILNRLIANGEFEVKIFGDKVILDEDVENWPVCDFLISFFSDGFPLDKAIAYARLRKPFCVNDIPMQRVLWDRRLCLRILDAMSVRTPQRVEVNRDGGPTIPSREIAQRVFEKTGVRLDGPDDGTGGGLPPCQNVELIEDGDALYVDGRIIRKPFVEKPVSGEDHNIHIYYPKHHGGGGRRLFRKINNKSSEKDETMMTPRCISEPDSSYVYEKFLRVENAEDVKAYTVGTGFCHAETRKSPTVDGVVKRNPNGKEIRYVTSLDAEESLMAAKIAEGFGQRVCGFDLLRAGGKSYVIDVNGWSFVKDNNDYYDKCASILRDMFENEKKRKDGKQSSAPSATPSINDEEVFTDSSHRSSRQRQHTLSNHRAQLKSIFRSPSMSKLLHHNPHANSHTQGTTSPDILTQTTPITSPPSFENSYRPPPSAPPTSQPEFLPPPAVEEAATDMASVSLPDDQIASPVPAPASKAQWKMKGMVSVIRHADRTPKQKFKFTFHTKPFVELLKGHQEEVLLIGEAALKSVEKAVRQAMKEGVEDPEKLKTLANSLARKGSQPGTKVQIKPMFRRRKKEEMLPGMDENTSVESQQSQVPDLAQVGSSLNPTIESPGKEGKNNKDWIQKRSESVSGGLLSRFAAAENNLILDKLQLIIKWGGEPTHAARYQAQDLGENMRNDLLLMNREALDNVHVFSSSERRVTTSAQIFAASFLHQKEVPEDYISIRKDLLDDSNAAKDEMDKVKKKLKGLLRDGEKAPTQFAWPQDMPEPAEVVKNVIELMKFHRHVMRLNYAKLQAGAVSSLAAVSESQSSSSSQSSPGVNATSQSSSGANAIQPRWCCGEDPALFKERWEKLFSEFCDSEKVDPSKISELYDTMKFDALHNRQFLEWIFTPELSEEAVEIATAGSESTTSSEPRRTADVPAELLKSNPKEPHGGDKLLSDKGSIGQRMGFRRKSEALAAVTYKNPVFSYPHESYFSLYKGIPTSAASRAKVDARLAKLRELYKYCKVLFDYIGPQEYGIANTEKLEIGLLTSLPLLKEIVQDLEELQSSEGAQSFFYFTKESHVYTLLNCILEGGIKTKIDRNAIPELDYLSQICFELYESQNVTPEDEPNSFNYSIRITISPGCHTFDPLDVQLDSKHSIGISPRRSLTAHHDWKEIIETLRARFHTVKLPKSFVAINLSEKVPHAFNLPNETTASEPKDESL